MILNYWTPLRRDVCSSMSTWLLWLTKATRLALTQLVMRSYILFFFNYVWEQRIYCLSNANARYRSPADLDAVAWKSASAANEREPIMVKLWLWHWLSFRMERIVFDKWPIHSNIGRHSGEKSKASIFSMICSLVCSVWNGRLWTRQTTQNIKM